MEITVNNNPVTIKTITIGKDKLNKNFLRQMPHGFYIYHLDKDNNKCAGVEEYFDFGNDYTMIDENYLIDGELIGEVKVAVDKLYEVKSWICHTNERLNLYGGDFHLVLYVNKEGVLMKSYIDDLSWECIDENIEQIYIY